VGIRGAAEKFDAQRVKDIHDRLAAYEDTWLEPPKIATAFDSAEKLIFTMRNNKKAALCLKKYGKAGEPR